jgi:ATP-dependent phosphoenolpyruvate carboxykinase
MSSFNLQQHEIAVEKIYRNLAPSALYEHAILYENDAHIAENDALVAYSGVKTGRSPKDKRVVKQGLRRTMSGGGRSISRSIRTHLRPKCVASRT